jgi:hypothetical protein
LGNPLASFVQISDLHFGELDPVTGSTVLQPVPPNAWRISHWFDGLLGHTYDAAVHLHDFFRFMRKTEKAQIICTGDLTVCGDNPQFYNARGYLTDVIRLNPYVPLGLQDPSALDRSLPGNHDHWPGSPRILGTPTAGLNHTFPLLPYLRRIPIANSGRTLVLAGINTDADVSSWGPSRFLARGRFISQLIALEGNLGPPSKNEIRILLMHHSRMYRSRGRWGTLEIHDKDRAALDQFIVNRDIAVLLSGHTHVPKGRIAPIKKHRILETCCGTTMQRDTPPLGWGGARTIRQTNSLLVHRLVELSSGDLAWGTDLYYRTVRGFERYGPLVSGPPYVVWPRPKS